MWDSPHAFSPINPYHSCDPFSSSDRDSGAYSHARASRKSYPRPNSEK